nr:peptidylprolyl isomerase [Govania unica]
MAQARNPNVQKIEAVVNDQVVSAYDVDQRVNLLLASVSAQISPEQKMMLRRQALQNLIDERLELQEAKHYDLVISEEEANETVAAIAQQYNMNQAQFADYLAKSGASIDALKQQLKAELAWNRLVRGRFRQQIEVSEEDVQAQIDRMKQTVGQSEYQVSEIFLLVDTPAKEEEARITAERIEGQLKQGVPFNVMARQFSEAPTAAVGGDLGWVQQGQLAPEVDQAILTMRPNEISAPIRTANGFYVVQLKERRKVLTPDASDERLTLQQAIYNKHPGETAESASARITKALAGVKSCADLTTAAKIGAQDINKVGTVRLGDLPPMVQSAVEKVEVGKHSAPVDTPEGFRVLFVCERVMPESKMPSNEQVSESMSQQRLSLMSRRYLRDLRRDAIIDIRG